VPGVVDAAATASAADYLSEEAFPGLHVIERVGEGPELLLHRAGQLPAAAGREPIWADASHWGSMAEARRDLEELLGIPAPEPLQTEWALFDAQGRRVLDVARLGELPVAFVVELGQWMWPAVRVGFEHTAAGVKGEAPAVLRTLSLRPVVFEVRDFITEAEAEEVMDVGRGQGLHSSEGVLTTEAIAQRTRHSEFRTSKQAWLDNGLAPVIKELDGRVANLTRVPASHNEPVQLLRYEEGEYYHGHMDWTELEFYPDQREVWVDTHFGHKDRLATVFWYLTDVAEGGETIFLKHGQPICDMESPRGGKHTQECEGGRDPDMTLCEKGLKVPPRRGTVLLWYNFHPNGRGDRNALHASCPVGSNFTKWSGNKWVGIKPRGAQAEWIDDHPAIQRHGWTGGSRSGPEDPDECDITFMNDAAEAADVMWYSPSTSSFQKIRSVSAGGSTSLQSYRRHTFQLWTPSRRSNKVTCQRGSMEFVLTSDHRLRRQAGAEL